MKTFKTYLEDRTYGLIPSQGTLEEFLRSLEGKTIKQILDDGSYMRLYHGNKFGMMGADEGSNERNAERFVDALTRWVNRDIKKMRPEVREYETPEFKQEYDYDSYQRARSKKARLGMDRMRARRGDASEEERIEIQDKIDKYDDEISNHPYQGAMRVIEKEYDEAVQNYHNSPLTADFLKDDGSELYDDLVASFTKLGGQSETVIDV